MVSEAEAGHITRQELVSMIPTLLMDVKELLNWHDSVFGGFTSVFNEV